MKRLSFSLLRFVTLTRTTMQKQIRPQILVPYKLYTYVQWYKGYDLDHYHNTITVNVTCICNINII